MLVTAARGGGQAAGDSSEAALGGGWIAFGFDAPNLVWHDTNAASDVFLRPLDAIVAERRR